MPRQDVVLFHISSATALSLISSNLTVHFTITHTSVNMFTKTLTLALLALGAVASPIEVGADVEKRACPGVHVFGARETTASPGKESPFLEK